MLKFWGYLVITYHHHHEAEVLFADKSVLILMASATAQTIVEYHRPSGMNGLIYQAFEVTPTLRFDAGPNGKDMILSMKVRAATAQNGVARFDFAYRYNGTLYTDKMIGADAFYPIVMLTFK